MTMQFEHEVHEETYRQVVEILPDFFDDLYHDEDDGHVYVRYGSTVLELSVDPYGPEESVVTVMSYCVQGVEIEEELLERLLHLNHQLPFGAFSLVGNDVFISHSLFGRTLDRSNLITSISAVATLSDDYDERIIERYGGQTALECIQATGGRRRRTARQAV